MSKKESRQRRWPADSKEAMLLAQARDTVKQASAVIAAFKIKLARDPCKALDNCDHVFEANGRRTVGLRVVDALTEPTSKATFDSLREYATRELRRMSSDVERSTSSTFNLVLRYMLVAWAQLGESMTRISGKE